MTPELHRLAVGRDDMRRPEEYEAGDHRRENIRRMGAGFLNIRCPNRKKIVLSTPN